MAQDCVHGLGPDFWETLKIYKKSILIGISWNKSTTSGYVKIIEMENSLLTILKMPWIMEDLVSKLNSTPHELARKLWLLHLCTVQYMYIMWIGTWEWEHFPWVCNELVLGSQHIWQFNFDKTLCSDLTLNHNYNYM